MGYPLPIAKVFLNSKHLKVAQKDSGLILDASSLCWPLKGQHKCHIKGIPSCKTSLCLPLPGFSMEDALGLLHLRDPLILSPNELGDKHFSVCGNYWIAWSS